MKVRTERVSFTAYPEELERYREWANEYGNGSVSKLCRDMIELGIATTQQKTSGGGAAA
jgi:hypothetical protein